jgi:hypothetical protein
MCGAPPLCECAGASHAHLTETRSLLVVVEIHNPTSTPLRLSQLEYTLGHGARARESGFVRLTQTIQPGGSLTVDISVPVRDHNETASAYDLEGKLSGFAGEMQVDWQISTSATVAQ